MANVADVALHYGDTLDVDSGVLELMTVGEAAQHLRVHPQTVRNITADPWDVEPRSGELYPVAKVHHGRRPQPLYAPSTVERVAKRREKGPGWKPARQLPLHLGPRAILDRLRGKR